jgi:hypothetical protein
VNPPINFKTDPQRDATNSIRGYVYQAYQSILAWMQLKENEILILEGSEDFDIYSGNSVTTTQVKNVSGNVTLRSQSVIDAINNYWISCERNPDYDVIMRFLTTAEAGQEQGNPFGPNQKGLEYWHGAALGQVEIEPLRMFLLTLGLNSNLELFIKAATDDDLREELICHIKWDMGNKPIEALQNVIEDKLKIHGYKFGINTHYSCQAVPHLLKKVADLLSTQGIKELRLGDFLSCFDEATTLNIPRGQMEVSTSGNSLQQIADNIDLAEIARLANRAPTIDAPIPIVDGGIPRTALVSSLVKILYEQRIIFLYGSSGTGKTNIAALIFNKIGGSYGWAGFRSMQPSQIKEVLARAAFEINETKLPPFLVLDDVDLSQVTLFEREFISLVFSVINSEGMVIVTGPTRPPLQLLPKIWKSETCEFTVPYFNETDVAEMVFKHGLSEGKHASAWTRTIWITTSGHPQLVHARVRSLSSKGWPSIELSDLTKPEDVERVRSEACMRLVREFPTDNTRTLAYRLSLINGAFSRETAMAVSETPPPTKLPGESFDALIGPWIEREGRNRYRISPLLKGAANNALSDAEINSVHGAIALSIIRRKSITQIEGGTALFHAFMAKNVEALRMLAFMITRTHSDKTHLLYDAMSWFTLICLEDGQKILPENPFVDLMLRVAQYKLITAAPKPDKVISIIARIEETLEEIEPPELKQHSEVLAYGVILNTIEVHIPSSIVIRILSRMIDLTEDNLVLKDVVNSFDKGQIDLPQLGENKPAQILFSYQGARLSGLDDLYELVISLDALPLNKRDQLLRICDSDMDFATLLISRAWWKEVKDGALDVNKTLRIFDFTATKARKWKIPEITKACLVAMSVVQDEYGQSTERALGILDMADKEFPNEARLIDQRAKVLFNAKRDAEALPIAHKALKLPGLSNIEFVFCCRNAGIAAAKSGSWEEAERLFMMGAEKAKHSSFQKRMGIGLTADAAFALWKQKKYKDSLLLFADALDSLATVTLSEDIRIRYLHASVRHIISWIHFEALREYPSNMIEPFPGMCSNQEPNEGIKDLRIIDISAAWELLASTENILELDIGIGTHSQKVTGGKKPLIMVAYSRTLAFDRLFKSKDFDNLVPKLIEMLEAVHHTEMFREKPDDGLVIGDVSKLPDGYWGNSENLSWIYHYLLEASVICTADNQVAPLPIERWRTDLTNAGALTADVNQFLNVLSGSAPDDSIYQQAAASIFKLRSGTLAPTDLWKASFRLLNVFMNKKRWVEKPLEGIIITRWIFAANNQRFAFTSPSLACPEVERRCLDQSFSGFAKIAAILDIATPYLNINLSIEGKQMLKKIIEKT